MKSGAMRQGGGRAGLSEEEKENNVGVLQSTG